MHFRNLAFTVAGKRWDASRWHRARKGFDRFVRDEADFRLLMENWSLGTGWLSPDKGLFQDRSDEPGGEDERRYFPAPDHLFDPSRQALDLCGGHIRPLHLIPTREEALRKRAAVLNRAKAAFPSEPEIKECRVCGKPLTWHRERKVWDCGRGHNY